MSRKDVTDADVVRAAHEYHYVSGQPFVDERLSVRTGEPMKVCQAAIERAIRHGYVECGVTERTCWPTPAGMALLAAEAAVPGGSR